MEIGLILIAIAVLLLYGFVGGRWNNKWFKSNKTNEEPETFGPNFFSTKTDRSCLDPNDSKYDHVWDPSGMWRDK